MWGFLILAMVSDNVWLGIGLVGLCDIEREKGKGNTLPCIRTHRIDF